MDLALLGSDASLYIPDVPVQWVVYRFIKNDDLKSNKLIPFDLTKTQPLSFIFIHLFLSE